jgi:hypothetical protein
MAWIKCTITDNIEGKNKLDCLFPSIASAERFEKKFGNYGGFKRFSMDIYGEYDYNKDGSLSTFNCSIDSFIIVMGKLKKSI